eukprot:759338-Hanusia_phi.AAC.3
MEGTARTEQATFDSTAATTLFSAIPFSASRACRLPSHDDKTRQQLVRTFTSSRRSGRSCQ